MRTEESATGKLDYARGGRESRTYPGNEGKKEDIGSGKRDVRGSDQGVYKFGGRQSGPYSQTMTKPRHTHLNRDYSRGKT